MNNLETFKEILKENKIFFEELKDNYGETYQLVLYYGDAAYSITSELIYFTKKLDELLEQIIKRLKETNKRKIIEEFLNEPMVHSLMGMDVKISPLVNKEIIIVHPKNFPELEQKFGLVLNN